MKPVAVIRHATTEEPGHFATFLESSRLPWQLIAIDRGDAVPRNSESFSGIAMMGGPMSVNDPLPWIQTECELIRDAFTREVPLIGHCLGGQLISKALGGEVVVNPVKEIGWHPVQFERNAPAEDWLGNSAREAIVFQWHGETFSLPPGADRIATGCDCANQAFVLGPHLAMQFHVEMTEDLIRAWCAEWRRDYDPTRRPVSSIQSPEEMLAQTKARLDPMRRLAERIYSRWVKGLRR